MSFYTFRIQKDQYTVHLRLTRLTQTTGRNAGWAQQWFNAIKYKSPAEVTLTVHGQRVDDSREGHPRLEQPRAASEETEEQPEGDGVPTRRHPDLDQTQSAYSGADRRMI